MEREKIKMIFSSLYESAQRGELILIDGGYCRWHLRTDGQITIYEIISTKRGAGQRMLQIIETTPNATHIVAKCPSGLAANAWYEKRGFRLEKEEKNLKVWRKDINQPIAICSQEGKNEP